MNRIKLSLVLMLGVCTTIAIPAAARADVADAAVTQADWTSHKKTLVLPNGLKISYVELGNPAGKPVLLLHGYTDSSRAWSLSAPFLSDYRLLIPDQRGHGASDAPACCYSLSAFADDARQLLDSLGIERAAVAGHSLGSMVAITMAAEYPERVTDVVLVGSTALPPVKRGDWLFGNVASLRWPLDPTSRFMRDWHPGNQPTPVDPLFAKAAMEDILAVKPHVWRSVMRELESLPVARHAADVKAPVLILSGGKDPLFPPEHHASLLKAFPNARAHVFPDLGHNPLWERPQDVARRIAGFLSNPAQRTAR